MGMAAEKGSCPLAEEGEKGKTRVQTVCSDPKAGKWRPVVLWFAGCLGLTLGFPALFVAFSAWRSFTTWKAFLFVLFLSGCCLGAVLLKQAKTKK